MFDKSEDTLSPPYLCVHYEPYIVSPKGGRVSTKVSAFEENIGGSGILDDCGG